MSSTILVPETESRSGVSQPGVLRRALEKLQRPHVMLRAVLYLTVLIYLPAVLFDYVYDDYILITFNPWMESWSKGIAASFTHVFWVLMDTPRPADYYRPLVMTVLLTVRHVAGTAPGWFHLVAIAIHVVAVYLTYRVALALTKNASMAAISAALFALHPSRIESTAWISGISDSMCLMFALASTLLYFRGRQENGGASARIWSPVCLLLAMLSKEMAIAIPALIAMYELLTATGPWFARVKATTKVIWPHAMAVAVVLGMRAYAMRHVVFTRGNSPMFLNALYSAPQAFLWYVGKQLWAVPVSVYYPVLLVGRPTFLKFVLPGIVVMCGLAWLVWRLRKSPVALFLLGWYVLLLLPVLVYEPALQLHDRYLYAPAVATSIGAAYLITRFVKQATKSGFPLRAAVVTALCLVLAGLTVREAQFWTDDVTLSTRAIKVGYDQSFPYEALTTAYCRYGDYQNAERVAILWATNTDDHVGGWSALAQTRREREDYTGAREAAMKAISVSKTPLGRVKPASILGGISITEGKFGEAEYWYKMAIAGEPNAPFIHYGYADALRRLGKTAEADRELEIYKKLRGYQGT